METLTLQCWFCHEDVDNIFRVNIATTETVADLQKVLKNENSEFRDVDAKNLNLYCIPLPDDESIEEELRQWTSSGKQRLPPRHKLSKYFPPDQTQRLIIVDVPTSDVTLNCWVCGQDIDRVFPVKISSEETVGVLKRAIKNEKRVDFRDVDADALRLYAVPNLTIDSVEGTAEATGQDKPLLPFSKLSDVFSDLLNDRIHVIIRVRAPAGQTTSGQAGEERGVIAALAEKFKLSMNVSSPAPSTAAKPGMYAKFQAGNGHLLDCRFSAKSPTETVAPPIQLFNPAFAFFSSKAFDPTYAVDDDNVCAARELMAEFAAIHDSETTRQLKIEPFISKAIGRDLKHTRNLDNTSPDYVVKSLDTSFPAYLVVVEEKNEFGEGGSDPSVQASFLYRNLLLQPESAEPRLRSGCPAFIIAHAGPWLSIMGGISLGRYVVQRLTDYVWVPQHSTHDDKQCLRIARIFCALKQSIAILDLWYKNLDPEAALYDPNDDTAPLHRRFWPSPITYRERGTNALVEFTYERPLEDRDTCVTYLAKTRQGNPKDIVVKFVTSYGVEAHEHMASKGFAPRLLSYGEISVPLDIPGVPSYSYGDLRMVVMEYVNGETLHNALKKRRIPPSFKSDLTEAFQHLHDQGYVYGDLRPPNIMVLPTGTSPSTAQLIDFDWAGKEGEVKYPSMINSSTIAWPQGVKGMACIERKHDEVMLTALMYTWLGGL